MGNCLDGDGTPSLWPWVQIVDQLLDDHSGATRERWLTGELGQLLAPGASAPTATAIVASNTQFQLFQRVVDLVTQVATQGPLLLLIDDLQWADVASVQLLSHLVGALPASTAIVGALRDHAPVPGLDLARALTVTSRVPGHRRVRLGPLGLLEVAELVRRQTGTEPDPGAVRSIHARTGGNPFFVHELARLVAGGGPVTEDATLRAGVPASVRDVLHDRIAGLDAGCRDLLRIASLVGRQADVDLVARAAGLDVQACLDRLEPLEALGLLRPTPGDPFSVHFAHDIVRESVCEAMPLRRTTSIPPADRRRARGHQRRARSRASRSSPLGCRAVGGPGSHRGCLDRRRPTSRWQDGARGSGAAPAGGCPGRAPGRPDRGRALCIVAAGDGGRHAIDVRRLQRSICWSVLNTSPVASVEERRRPGCSTRWAAHAQGIQLELSGPLARRLLDEGDASGDPILCAYGLNAWGIHQWAVGNIGDAFRFLTRAHDVMDGERIDLDQDPVGYGPEPSRDWNARRDNGDPW